MVESISTETSSCPLVHFPFNLLRKRQQIQFGANFQIAWWKQSSTSLITNLRLRYRQVHANTSRQKLTWCVQTKIDLSNFCFINVIFTKSRFCTPINSFCCCKDGKGRSKGSGDDCREYIHFGDWSDPSCVTIGDEKPLKGSYIARGECLPMVLWKKALANATTGEKRRSE